MACKAANIYYLTVEGNSFPTLNIIDKATTMLKA